MQDGIAPTIDRVIDIIADSLRRLAFELAPPQRRGPVIFASLITDKDNPIASTPADLEAQKKHAGDPNRQEKALGRDKGRYEKAGGYQVDPGANSGANCHGTTFGKGEVVIDNDQVPPITRDNYKRVNTAPKGQPLPIPGQARQQVQVCDILVWGGEGHSGLVVEVVDGEPTMVFSKDGWEGELWAHPPAAYGTDWAAHNRDISNLSKEDQNAIADLKKAHEDARQDYAKAKAKSDASGAQPDKDATAAARKKMHNAAYALCRRKNALKQKK